mgnify:CR=1 FL=1
MNRNEAISREEAVRTISRISGGSVSYAEDLYDSFFPKPVVPQCVADWYEENKDEFEINLFQCIGEAVESYEEDSSSEFESWLMSDDSDALTVLVNMHQFGYEVKKEPRYAVSIKGIKVDKGFLNYDKFSNTWSFEDDDTGVDRFRAIHTRKELEKAGFGEVFDNPMFEIEEVE